ncbi:MAG: methyl-accepting chemotaxis protein [Opitutaceae bacterium]
MNTKPSSLTIKTRLRLLAAMSMALAATIAGFSYFALTRAEEVAGAQLKDRLLEGEKSRLELTTRNFAESLSTAIAGVADPAAQVAVIRKAIADLRFEEDKSGYFFVYEGTTVRILGPSPALEGKDLSDKVDTHGVPFIRELASAAAKGGGFVHYVFPKPGSGDQPKISFATPIKGAAFWIGTGVYIDRLAQLQSQGEKSMHAALRPIVGTASVVGLAAFIALSVASWIAERRISTPLRRVMTSLGASAAETTTASAQVSNASNALAAGSSEQAASLEETSSSLEEMRSMTTRSSESAITAKTSAGQARDAAESGAEQMKRMTVAMDQIQESSQEIAKIIKTIDEIAFQTNILALNAAVEAARAGEAGAGFAVVADEVRSLAQRSAKASRETADKIESALVRSKQGAEISKSVGVSLSTILQHSRDVDRLVGEIAHSAQEQKQGIGEIANAVAQMDTVVQRNAAGAEETASAAEELNAQAFELQEVVRDLGSMVDRAKSDVPTARPEKAMVAPPAKKSTLMKVRPAKAPEGDFFAPVDDKVTCKTG